MFQILIAEDDKNTARLMMAVLKRAGYDIHEACNGAEALEVMDLQHIDLIVLDVMMPVMDGYEFTRQLRAVGDNTPILMVTAKDLPEEKCRGFIVGTDDYMVKPVNEEELQSVELLRSDFVGNFSHEFKTPITSIRGFAKALKWDDLTPEEREEYLDIIISESERLSTLSLNVLYLSKIENQRILADKKRYNLTEQLRLAAVLLDQKLSEKQLELIFDANEFFVVANEKMLEQVWINLLDNAIKFSPNGGTIEIRMKQTGSSLSVKISDQGSGMSPETKEHIFDKFYQGDLSHSANGNGLGLTIVQKIIDLHGGSIVVHSSDRGSTFEVILRKR